MYKLFFPFSLLVICFIYACTPSQKISKSFITTEQVVVHEAADKNGLPLPQFPSFVQVCGNQMNYAPDSLYPEHTPMRWVRVNFHFIDQEEGGVSFPESIGREFAQHLIKIANQEVLQNAKMHLPPGNNTPVLPPRYQYVLTGKEEDKEDDGIYFHKDDELYQFNKKGGKYSLFSRNQYRKFGIRKDEVINVFFVEHHPDSIKSPTYKASRDGVGTTTWAKVAGAYQYYDQHPKMPLIDIARNISGILNHELGHSLSLRHTWKSNDGCDDTPQNPNCWNVDKRFEACDHISKISNNMMDYNAWRNALTPCQIGRIHHKFSQANSTQRRMLVPTWCDYKPEATIRIPSGKDIIWSSMKDLEGDVVIEKDASLTLQCVLSLPAKAKISVAVGGKLLLDGATITNRCGDLWEGIEVEKQGKEIGIVEVISSSKIEKVVHPVDNLKISQGSLAFPIAVLLLLFGIAQFMRRGL